MASPYLETKTTESVLEKRKYFSKVLSESAIWTNFQRILDTLSLFSEWAWSESLFFIWLDISNLFIFGLDPTELLPLDPEFHVKLPTIQEFLQGIKLKLEPVDVGEAWRIFYWDIYNLEVPPLLDFVTFIIAQCWPEYLGFILEQQKRKLIVGESVYGKSYVDPPVIREFIRSSLWELARRRMDLTRIRQFYQVVVDKARINEGIVEAIYNRLVLHFHTIFDKFILDYNLLNYSKLCEAESETTKIGMVTWRGEYKEIEFKKFDEVNCGFILDITPLNLGILMDDKILYKPSPLETHDTGTTVLSDFIDWKTRRMISRYFATSVAFGNYQRPEETLSFHTSERADHHHQLRTFYYYIDAIVDSILEKEDVSIFHKNLYKRATAMLIGHKKKRHKWGYEAYKAMTEEEFKEYWLGYWEKQGLNTSILNKIYQVIGKWVKRYRRNLEDLGESLKRKRYNLSQMYA